MVMFWFVDDQCPHWLSTEIPQSPHQALGQWKKNQKEKKEKEKFRPSVRGTTAISTIT
jgi:hypothetical protein